jgi:hypothetical protein
MAEGVGRVKNTGPQALLHRGAEVVRGPLFSQGEPAPALSRGTTDEEPPEPSAWSECPRPPFSMAADCQKSRERRTTGAASGETRPTDAARSATAIRPHPRRVAWTGPPRPSRLRRAKTLEKKAKTQPIRCLRLRRIHRRFSKAFREYLQEGDSQVPDVDEKMYNY